MSRNATLFDLDRPRRAGDGRQLGHRPRDGAGAGRCRRAVVLVARREDALREAAQRIAAAGGKAAHVACDVSERSRLGDCVARGRGPLRRSRHPGERRRNQPARARRTGSPRRAGTRSSLLNLTVPFFLARHMVPAMIAKGWGRIINVASLQSVRAFPDSAPYGASKGGVVQLTRAMAEAWSANGVTCNAIGPGFFPTRADRAGVRRRRARRGPGRAHDDRPQRRARGSAWADGVPRRARLRLHHRPDHLCRRRIQRQVSRGGRR